MTTQEFKKKIHDTVEPLLDGQGQVRFEAQEYAKFNMIIVSWLSTGDNLIADAMISEIPTLEHTRYLVDCLFGYDYAGQLNAYANAYSEPSEWSAYRHFFEDWTGVEKTLQGFTRYLVKEFN